MGKQNGIITLQGTVGNITFVRSEHGVIAREKTYRKKGELSVRTRENNEEFSRAGKAVKLVRSSLSHLVRNTADRSSSGRLIKTMMKIIKADTVSVRGQRNVIDGEIAFLQGFEFNLRSPLSTSFNIQYEAIMDREAGKVILNVPAYSPKNQLPVPVGATHYQLVAAAAELDFETPAYKVETKTGEEMPFSGTLAGPISFELPLSTDSKHPWILVIGILYYQEVNGVLYILENGTFNSLAVVKTDGNV